MGSSRNQFVDIHSKKTLGLSTKVEKGDYREQSLTGKNSGHHGEIFHVMTRPRSELSFLDRHETISLL